MSSGRPIRVASVSRSKGKVYGSALLGLVIFEGAIYSPWCRVVTARFWLPPQVRRQAFSMSCDGTVGGSLEIRPSRHWVPGTEQELDRRGNEAV